MSKYDKNFGIDGDELSNYIKVLPSEVFVPEGRFRPLDMKAVKVLKESIVNSGQLEPIIIDKMGNLIDGNHRLKACEELKINIEAKVIDEVDTDKLALIEIDTNLIRKELTQTEVENHLAERKKIYLKLFPETAQGGKAKGNKQTFAENTAEATGESVRNVQRKVKRGEESTPEMQEARDNGEINNKELDTINKETEGQDTEVKNQALKDLIKKKIDKKEKPEVKEVKSIDDDTPPFEVNNETLELEHNKLLEKYETLELEHNKLLEKYETLEVKLEKAEKSVKNYRDRIKKAKDSNPELKI